MPRPCGAIACTGHSRCLAVSFMQAAQRGRELNERLRCRSAPQRTQSVHAPLPALWAIGRQAMASSTSR